MNRLYIRFAGDNDFCMTVKAFIEAIAPRVLLGEWTNITKKDIVRLFNEHSFTMYAYYQSRSLYAKESVKSYLKIKTKDVYFDDEIDAFTDYNSDGCLAALEYEKIGYYIM